MIKRLIEPGPDLPRNFAIIESSSYAAAIADMKQAFHNPGTELVVWRNAGDLALELKNLPDLTQFPGITTIDVSKEISGLIKDQFLPGFLKLKARHNRLFSEFEKCARLPFSFRQAWQNSSADLAQALRDGIKTDLIQTTLRLRRVAPREKAHRDLGMDINMLVIRVVGGDKTHYFASEDVEGYGNKLTICEGATRWIAPDLSVAFHSRRIVHSAPSVDTGSPQGQWRPVEIHQMHCLP